MNFASVEQNISRSRQTLYKSQDAAIRIHIDNRYLLFNKLANGRKEVIHMPKWEDLKIFEVVVSYLVPAYTAEGARKHIEKTCFHNHILEVKELPKEEDPQA